MVELNKAGTNVIAICRHGSKIEQSLASNGIQCEHLPNYAKLHPLSIRKIKHLISTHNVDVVHVHFHRDVWTASMALRTDQKRKLFLSVYMGVNPKNDVFHRYIYKRVNGIFASSQEFTSRLHTLYPVPKEKIHFLPYGRRLELYTVDQEKRKAIRAALGVKRGELLVGTMVRIDPGKGVMDFARSFLYLEKQRQSKVKYMIIGEPTRKGRTLAGQSPYEPHCEAYLQQLEAFIVEENLNERILLTGFQENFIDYLSALDVFVFPSRDELYSLVVLDAMAMQLPILAARAGGTLQQITDGVNGLFYHVADSKDLAEKLLYYVKNPDIRNKHGKAAREFVEKNHDMKKTISQLLKLYHAN